MSTLIEILTNPILAMMVWTFIIGMSFTIWSVLSDWNYNRKTKKQS